MLSEFCGRSPKGVDAFRPGAGQEHRYPCARARTSEPNLQAVNRGCLDVANIGKMLANNALLVIVERDDEI